MRPVIGITADLAGDRVVVNREYVDAVVAAGGAPVIIPPSAASAAEIVARCDAVILSGGADPIMERWGVATHPKAHTMDPARQDAELSVLAALDAAPEKPALGVCLGMQLMGLHRGGAFNQHLPDTHPSAEMHQGNRLHLVSGDLGSGLVTSRHRQALSDPGTLRVVATAEDGVIEAVADPARRFYLGVQWHPERTPDPELGAGLIAGLVAAARR